MGSGPAVICESCNGSGTVQGAKGAAVTDKAGNKTKAHGANSSGQNQPSSFCRQCNGKGYYS